MNTVKPIASEQIEFPNELWALLSDVGSVLLEGKSAFFCVILRTREEGRKITYFNTGY